MTITFDSIRNFFLGSSSGTLDQNFSKVKDEFSKTIYRDGSNVMQGNLDMNGRRVINHGFPVGGSDLVTLNQVKEVAANISQGPPGTSDNTYTSLAALLASEPSRRSARLVGDPLEPNGSFFYSEGQWRRETTDSIKFRQRYTSDKLSDVVSLEDKYSVSWAQAQQDAEVEANSTGAALEYRSKPYVGARLESHGRTPVHANGAKLDYAALGKTLVGGLGNGSATVPYPWTPDPSETVALQYDYIIYGVNAAVKGDKNIVTTSLPTTLDVGEYGFIAGNTSSLSSDVNMGNWIPKNFEFFLAKSKSGTNIGLTTALKNTYNSTRCVTDCVGVPVGVTIRDLVLTTNNDAYQHVVRSSINCSFENIIFTGDSAVGAATFSDNLTYRNCHAIGSYGSFSTARGCGRVTYEDCTWRPRASSSERMAWFVEESFYDISLIRCSAFGGYASIRQVDMSGVTDRRVVTMRDCRFDTSIYDDVSPLMCGSVLGADIVIDGCHFIGPATQPSSYGNSYPSFGSATGLTWVAGSLAGDQVIITNTIFECTNGDGTTPAIIVGGGFQGTLIIDYKTCTFINCTPPKPPVFAFNSPYAASIDTQIAPASYRKDSRNVYFSGGFDTNSAADNSVITTLPTDVRPKFNKTFLAPAFGGTTDYVKLLLMPSGVLRLANRNGATTIAVDGLSYSLEV